MYEVTNRTTFPYSAICYIEVTFADGYTARGSGVVVGLNDVLTAMHVVYNQFHGGFAETITIMPGADTEPRLIEPFGRFDGARVNSRVSNWDTNGDDLLTDAESQYDIALIGTRARIGDTTGWMGMSNTRSDFTGTMAGYPARGTGLMAERVFADASSSYGVFDINSGLGGGASGGPLFNDANAVVGVASSGNSSDTVSTYAGLFSPGTWDWLTSVMAGNDSLMGGTPAPAPSPSPSPSPSPAPTPRPPAPPPPPAPAVKTGTAGDDDYYFETSLMPTGTFTLSDPGGKDTFNIYLVKGNHVIDLNPGALSTIGNSRMTIASGTVIEDVLSYDGNDSISGNSAANTLWGEGGMDQLTGRGGNDYLHGGLGVDTAIFSGARSGYTVTGSNGSYTVTDRTIGRDGTDTLVSIERLKFSDTSVAMDVAGNAGKAYRLYQAAFNRTPDTPGLGFQIRELDNGQALNQVAQNFINSPEFARAYGSLNTPQFVTQLYQNVLHRAPDVAGLSFYTNNLTNGTSTRSSVLIGFSESPENQAAVIGVIQNGMVFTG